MNETDYQISPEIAPTKEVRNIPLECVPRSGL